MTVTFTVQNGTVTLLTTGVTDGITVQVQNNGTANVSVTAPLAAIVATLAAQSGLTYNSTSAVHISDTLTISANDGSFGNSDTQNLSLLVAGPLTFVFPTTQQVVKIGGSIPLGGVQVSDPSLPTTDMVSVTLAASNGTVTLATSVSGGITSTEVTNNDSASVTVNAKLDELNNTLAATGGLTYTPNSGYVGTDSLTIGGNDTLGNNSSGDSIPLVVAGPLTIAAPTTQQLVSVGGTTGLPSIAITDPSLPTTVNVSLSLGVTNGTLSVPGSVTGGVVSSDISGNGTNSVTITAPLAAINATLAAAAGLTYAPTGGTAGMDTLTLNGSDTLGNTESVTESLLAVGPLSVTAPTAVEALKVGGSADITGVSLADPSLPTTQNVTLQLSATDGTLSVSTTVTNGIGRPQVTGNGTNSVTITAPLAAINATLADAAGLSYTSTTGGQESIALKGTDSTGNQGTGTVQFLDVGPLTFNVPTAAQLAKVNGSLVFSGVSLADPSLPTTDNVTVTLGVTNGTLNLSTTVANGLTSGDITANGTNSVTITAPLAAINATLADANGLTYTPNTDYAGTDTLSLSGSDTLGNSGTGSVSLVDVGPLTIAVPSTQQLVASNGTLSLAGVSIADPSLPTSSNVTVTFSATHGNVALSTAVTGGITAAQVTGNGTGSVTVIAPLAAINATLADANGLGYTSTNTYNGGDARVVTAQDAATNSNTARISLVAVGPLTVVTPSALQAVAASTALAISGVSLTDPSLPTTDNVQLVFGAQHGTVTLSTTVTGGLTASQVTGNGTGAVTIDATLAEINATLADPAGLSYQGASGYNGSDTLSLTANDTVTNNATGNVNIAVGLTVNVPAAVQTVAANGSLAVGGIMITDPRSPPPARYP